MTSKAKQKQDQGPENDDQNDDLMGKIFHSLSSCESEEYLVSADQGRTESRFLPIHHGRRFLKPDGCTAAVRHLYGITVASWPLFVHWSYTGKLPKPDEKLSAAQVLQLYQQLADFAHADNVSSLQPVVLDAITGLIDHERERTVRMVDYDEYDHDTWGSFDISNAIANLVYFSTFIPSDGREEGLRESMKNLMMLRVKMAKGAYPDEYHLDEYETLYPGLCQTLLADILGQWDRDQVQESIEEFQQRLKTAKKKKRKTDQ